MQDLRERTKLGKRNSFSGSSVILVGNFWLPLFGRPDCPGGVKSSSQGRKPLEFVFFLREALEGRHRSCLANTLSPLSGLCDSRILFPGAVAPGYMPLPLRGKLGERQVRTYQGIAGFRRLEEVLALRRVKTHLPLALSSNFH